MDVIINFFKEYPMYIVIIVIVINAIFFNPTIRRYEKERRERVKKMLDKQKENNKKPF